MFYKIKKFTMVLIVSNLFMSQSLMADMLFYYSAAILPSIVASNQQSDPVADAGEDKTTMVNQAVTIMGSGTDSDGIIVSYEWKKGSEVLSTDATFSYIPTAVGIDVLTLTVIDNDDNNDTDTMTVTVTDGTAPVISVTGINPLTVDQDSTYIDAGATATDDVDDTVTVTTTGSVDTSIVGEYILTYTAEDSAGNQATPKTRTVHVVDVTPPVITITGDVAPTVEHKSTYIDAGATATDNVDTTVTVTSSGSVDTNILGDYAITYNAADVAGNNAISVERTVHVVDTIAPTFTSSSTALVDENQNTAITLVATDTNTITYSMSGGDANDFNINGESGVVTFKIAPDYESGKTTYTFTAKATDGASNVAEQSVTISIKDIVDTAPTLGNTDLEVVENAEEGTVVGSVTVVDSGDSAITGFTLTSTGEGNFTIDSSGEIVVATGAILDYETTPVYHLNAVASNGFGSSESVSVDINVTEYINIFQTDKFLSSDIEKEDYFGGSVSISGDYIVVGANGEDTGGSRAGAAYLYKRNLDGSVREIAKIQAGDREVEDYFGSSVSIHGDYIVVGASGSDTGGAAYLYKIDSNSSVNEIAKIMASDKEAGDNFGHSVSISGDYIIVGAYGEDTGGSSAGAAYLYKINLDNSVSEISKIQSRDIEAEDYFGISVSISGDYIVVGAYGEDQGYSDYVGAVYLFKRDSDSSVREISKIQASDKGGGDLFGVSVSISGDYIVVGTGGDKGAAYLYKIDSNSSVNEIAKIITSDQNTQNSFGISVSISGDYIVVGAYLYGPFSTDFVGAAYLFKRDSDSSVSEICKIQSSDKEVGDHFGISVSISGDYIVVGANGEDTGGTDAGSAYLFDLKATNKPYIYNAPSIIRHNEALVTNNVNSFIGASPSGDVLTFSIEGVDSGAFTFTDNNLSFDPIADFENPNDDNGDNDYNITIIATDANSQKTSVDVDIVLNDKYYLNLAKLQAMDKAREDFFGNSVSISGDYIIVGASGDLAGYHAGSAYLYKIDSEGLVIEIAKIEASDKAIYDHFGNSVSISGDYIVVGASHKSTYGENRAERHGAAYLYKIDADNTVREIAKIQASDKEAGDNFGHSVSISGDYIIVGAYGEDTGGSSAGAAYLYKINLDNSVSEISKIQSSDIAENDHFGNSVSISGDYIVVGAYGEGNWLDYNGAAYLFKRDSDSSVSEIAKITANSRGRYDYFGYAVSISGDYIVVGAYGSEIGGASYLYKRDSDSSLSEISKFQASDKEAYDNFGYSVSISGDYIVVGAKGESTGGFRAGASYLFRLDFDNSVREIDKIQATDRGENDHFGGSVSISGENIVVGSGGEDTGGTDAGAAYLFVKDVNQVE